jgi:hypothetical protein
MSIYTRCRNGHSVRHRFTTKQGHLRCELCLHAARERWSAKNAGYDAASPKRVAVAFLKAARAIAGLNDEAKRRVLLAAAVVHGLAR